MYKRQDDAEEPKVLGPPPGLGQTEASDAAVVLPGVPSHSSIDGVTKDLSDADAVVEEVSATPDLVADDAEEPKVLGPPPGLGQTSTIEDGKNRDDEPFTEPSLPSAPKPEEATPKPSAEDKPKPKPKPEDDLAKRFAALKRSL